MVGYFCRYRHLFGENRIEAMITSSLIDFLLRYLDTLIPGALAYIVNISNTFHIDRTSRKLIFLGAKSIKKYEEKWK